MIRAAEAASVKRVYLSAGIHGDEPAGPLALAELLEENRWPEAFYLVDHKSPISYTFESPSDYERTLRVAALKAAVKKALRWVVRES